MSYNEIAVKHSSKYAPAGKQTGTVPNGSSFAFRFCLFCWGFILYTMNRPTSGIAVDASTRGNPGPSEYRGVAVSSKEILFHVKIGIATNNITEFIALSHAVFLAINKGLTCDIYTDSITALSWLKNKRANSKLTLSRNTQMAVEYLERVEAALQKLDIEKIGTDEILINKTVSVLKWYTSEWGEIPADFGLKTI